MRSDVVISINDTGIRFGHEDLAGTEDFPNWKVIAGWDFVDEDGVPDEPPGGESHGTALAGVAAASTNNEIGMAGVAWGHTRLLAVRMCDLSGSPRQFSVQGIDYARSHLADVVCLGYWGQEPLPDEAAAVHNAHFFGEVLCVAAAGWSPCWPVCFEDPAYPAAYPGVLGVTQSADEGYFAGEALMGEHVDLTAPGRWVVATTHLPGGYALHSGTSIAAAHAVGAAAMLESWGMQLFDPLQYPLFPEDIGGVLEGSARPLTSHGSYNESCCGHGLLGLGDAMARLAYPFNRGDGPTRHVRYEADDSTVVRIFRPHPSSDTLYYEHRVCKFAGFGGTEYDSVFAWGYHRGFTLGAIPNANDEDEMHWRYCEVVPGTITSASCSLETAVYLRTVDGKPDGWIPCAPGELTWWFGVSGIPLDLAVEDAGSSEGRGSPEISGYPNPFNPATCIRFSVSQETRAVLNVYDVRGSLVCCLLDRNLLPGKHESIWDGPDSMGNVVPAGVYFCRLSWNERVLTRKVVKLK